MNMKKKKKFTWQEFKALCWYRFNEMFSKGVKMQFIMLLVAVIIVIAICGTLAGALSQKVTIPEGVWTSLMHILDPGNLGGTDIDDKVFLSIMFISTVLGLLLMGTIVGIIDNTLERYMDKLSQGQSKVMEDGHLLIIGFNENIYCMLREQMESNENYQGNRSIVVLDTEDSKVMAAAVDERLHLVNGRYSDKAKRKSIKESKLIFRSGNIINDKVLDMVTACRAKAIIINKEDDFETIRTILALTRFLKDKGSYMNEHMPTILAMMNHEENIQAANVAAGIMTRGRNASEPSYDMDGQLIPAEFVNKIQIMFFENILAHIFAQVCRQPGLSMVITELFNYEDTEIYIEDDCMNGSFKDMVGKTYAEITGMVKTSIPIGIQKKNKECFLNPPLDYVLQEGEKLIHIAEDDFELDCTGKPEAAYGEPGRHLNLQDKPYNILILGWNEPLPIILENINEFSSKGSHVTILADEEYNKDREVISYDHLQVEFRPIDLYHWDSVKDYLDQELDKLTNILLLCQDGLDQFEADRKTAVLLLNLRSYLEHKDPENRVNITSEMNLVEDQHLLQETHINDFVVGSEMANRMLIQVANNPDMYSIFHQLLNNEGAEIYMRRIDNYVDVHKPFNWQYLVEQTSHRWDGEHEVVIGWIKNVPGRATNALRLNPKGKNHRVDFYGDEFRADDRLVVIANELWRKPDPVETAE